MSLSPVRLLFPALLACLVCFGNAAAIAEVRGATITGAIAIGAARVGVAGIGNAGVEVAGPGRAPLRCGWTPVADPRHPEYPPRLVLKPVLKPVLEPGLEPEPAQPLPRAVPGVAPLSAHPTAPLSAHLSAHRSAHPAAHNDPEEIPADACAAIPPLHPAVLDGAVVHPAAVHPPVLHLPVVHPAAVHPAVVHAASVIAMVEQSEQARITLSVVALEEGAIGSVIRCRSSLAGAILLGRVVDSSTVERIAPEGGVQW